MRASLLGCLLVIAGCSAMNGDQAVSSKPKRETVQPVPHSKALRADAPNGPFTGVWQLCDVGVSPDECSEYRLVQHADRICGTWSYVATNAGYEGRLVAHGISATEARRVRVCGRPGSETRTECDAGWEKIDKPLRICDGTLVESNSSDGECRAPFARARGAEAQLRELARQPWMQACLAGSASEAARRPIPLP